MSSLQGDVKMARIAETANAVQKALKPQTTAGTVAMVLSPALYAAIKVAEGFIERAREKQGLPADVTKEPRSRKAAS